MSWLVLQSCGKISTLTVGRFSHKASMKKKATIPTWKALLHGEHKWQSLWKMLKMKIRLKRQNISDHESVHCNELICILDRPVATHSNNIRLKRAPNSSISKILSGIHCCTSFLLLVVIVVFSLVFIIGANISSNRFRHSTVV